MFAQGTATEEEINELQAAVDKTFGDAFANSKTYKARVEWLDSKWSKFKSPEQWSKIQETGVAADRLLSVSLLAFSASFAVLTLFYHHEWVQIGKQLVELPKDFKLHAGVNRVIQARAKMFEKGEEIDWATAEALAFATLMQEGQWFVHFYVLSKAGRHSTFGDHRQHCQAEWPRCSAWYFQPPPRCSPRSEL